MDIHKRLEDIKIVAQHEAKEFECNYTVFQHAGDTYEFVANSYWEKDRPHATKLFLYDKDGTETDLRERGITINTTHLEEEKVEKIDDSEQDAWQPLETTPFDSDRIVSINCDTRDFHCGWTIEDKREKKPDLTKVNKVPDRFFMTLEEIKEILLELREKTGGTKPTWRYLSFIDDNDNWLDGGWMFKYLRFYKTEKGWYCQPDNDGKVIKKEILKYKINKEQLNAH